jgi:hypothetical protein
MRYLRLLVNTLAAGALGAAYLTVLLLQLNPQLPLRPAAIAEWYAVLALFYGVHLAVLFYVLVIALELAGLGVTRPAWISVRLLAWMGAVLAGAAALLMWLNLRAFAPALDADAAARLAAGAAAVSLAAGLMLLLAVVYDSVGRHGSRAAAIGLLTLIAGSVALPVVLRGERETPPAPARRSNLAGLEAPAERSRVLLVLLDGASLDYLWPRAAEGRFPTLGRLLDAGAAMDLATLRPTQVEPIWTAVATGKYPRENGVRSAALYRVRPGGWPVDLLPDHCYAHALVRFGFVAGEPITRQKWRASPLWAVLARYGIAAGVVRWPAAYPAEPVPGFLVTDRVHLAARSLVELADERSAHPPDALAYARALLTSSEPVPEIAPAGAAPAGVLLEPPAETPARWDRLYGRLARDLAARAGPALRLLAVRYTGLDAVGHAYLRYALPREFGDVSQAELERFGQVLDRYYALVDAEIAELLRLLGPDDLLLVVSGYGMRPLTPPKRLLARLLREPPASGTHEGAPDGFLLAYGAQVAPGKRPRGAVVDVAPTVLYYLGLPVGRDMDGYARADLFDTRFTSARPIAFVGSYDP